MRRFGVICAHIVLPALLAVAVMTIGERIVGDTPIASAVAPTGYVWADRVFTSKTALDGWLRARGSDFKTWAERHPAAARLAPPQVVTTRTSRNVALLTLAVGGFVAVSLAFALFLRYFRLAVVRPVLAPVLGRGGA